MTDRSMGYRFVGSDNGLGKTMTGLGDKSDKLHGQLGKLAGAFAGGVVGTAAVSFLKSSISDASDLGESLSKVRVVFGDSSKAVEAFAKSAATGIGQSQQEALEAAGTFGNLFGALGLGQKQAAGLSTKIIGLAGDLASFNNASPADVLEALKSGLLGEAEPLRKFGVTLSAARVEAEALSAGLVKPVKDGGKVRTALLGVESATNKLAKAQKDHGAKSLQAKLANNDLIKANQKLAEATKGTVPELTAAQKAQASYNVIMKDTKLAQGDFARTSGGLANQQRILKAEWKDASAELGTKLLPIATKVTTALTEQLEPGSKFRDVLSDLGENVAKFSEKAKPIFTYIGDHPDMFKQIAKDAVVIGAVLKASSFLKGMGLLRGGGRLPVPGGVGAASSATPVRVWVVNPGFGTGAPGTGGPVPVGGVPGGGPAGPKAPGLGGATGLAFLGLGALRTSGDLPGIGGMTAEQTKAMQEIALNKGKGADKLSTPDIKAIATFLVGSKDKTSQEYARFLQKELDKRAHVSSWDDQRARQHRRDLNSDDPKVAARARREGTPGNEVKELTRAILSRPPVVNNHYNITANGMDLPSLLKEAQRRGRVAALANRVSGAGRLGETG